MSADDLVIGTANCTRPESSGGWGGTCQIKLTPFTNGCTAPTSKYVGLCDAGASYGCCVLGTSTASGPFEDRLISEASCNGQSGICKIRVTPSSDGCDNATENYVGLCQHWYSANADGCCVPKVVTPSPAAGCASPNTCESAVRGDCPGGRLSNGSCTGANAGKLCCAPSAPADCSAIPIPAGCPGIPVPGAPTTISFGNPLGFDTVEGVLGKLLGELRGIIVVLSLVFIVIGAVIYITSAGDEGRMKTAKGAITAAMIGLAIGIAAPSFLKQIGDILGWGPVSNSLPAGTRTLTEIALSILQFLLSVVGILGIIMLVIGGLTYITASGDEGRAETGKKIVTYAIIGIAVALTALIIVTQIAALFV